jgi:hypothetical protein
VLTLPVLGEVCTCRRRTSDVVTVQEAVHDQAGHSRVRFFGASGSKGC